VLQIAAGIVLSYICGSIPFGIIITRVFKGVDVRSYGSGSTGFTNVFRVAGPTAGAIVAILDIAKGFLPVMVLAGLFYSPDARFGMTEYQIACGVAAVIGHILTIFARFKGGKGVLTALGVLVGLLPIEVGIAFLSFLIVFAITRYISAGSLIAATVLLAVVVVERFGLGKDIDSSTVIFVAVIVVIIFIAHRSNIKRLVKGEENKFKRVKL